jgi:hypothetical protein
MKTTRNLWPFGILAAFALFFCGLTTAIVIASTHHETMVSENYYEQEITFQDQIDGAIRAQKSGATIVSDDAGGKVVVSIPAAHLAQKFSGTIQLYRPSDPKLDQTLQFSPRADGTQTLDGSKLSAGLWSVRVKWNAGGETYFLERKVTIAGI